MEKPPIYEYSQQVKFIETDAAGIVYFSNIPAFFDESFISAMRTQDIYWEDFEKLEFIIPIVEQKTTFKEPLRPGDHYSIFVAITNISRKSFTSHHFLVKQSRQNQTNSSSLDQVTHVASGYISRVVVDYHTFRPKLIPEKLQTALKTFQISLDEFQQYTESLG